MKRCGKAAKPISDVPFARSMVHSIAPAVVADAIEGRAVVVRACGVRCLVTSAAPAYPIVNKIVDILRSNTTS
jgi:hypothetical protein